jgi:ankyrin repeat protein
MLSYLVPAGKEDAAADTEFPMAAWDYFGRDQALVAIRSGSYAGLKAIIEQGRPSRAAQVDFVMTWRALHSGASMLCMSILYGKFTEVGRPLVQEFGAELVSMRYERPPARSTTPEQRTWYRSKFEGESCLHLAIVKGLPIADLRFLLERAPATRGGAPYSLIEERAVGSYFAMRCAPGTQAPTGKCAWGELALSFAVCLNLPEVVRFLVVEGGADLLACDSANSWTAMHMAVLCDHQDAAADAAAAGSAVTATAAARARALAAAGGGSGGAGASGAADAPGSRLEMIRLLEALWERVLRLREQERRAGLAPGSLRLSPTALRSPPVHAFASQLARRPDAQGRTALILAASERKISLFTELWRLASQLEWGFAENRCAFYPLNDIEEWGGAGGSAAAAASVAAAAPPASPAASPTQPPPPAPAAGHRVTPAFDLLTFDNDEAGSVMSTEPFKELLARKWAGYAAGVFRARLACVLANNVLLTYCTSQAIAVEMRFSSGPLAARLVADAVRARGEGWALLLAAGAAVLGFAAAKAYMTLVDFRALDCRLDKFFGAKGSTSLERWLSLGYCGCTAVVAGSYAAGVSDAHFVPMCLAFMPIFSWLYMLWFLLGYEQHAQLVLMLWQMLFVDLYRFSTLSTLIILAVSAPGAGGRKRRARARAPVSLA